MKDLVLRVENVTRVLEGKVPVTLVADVDLEVRSGEFIAISGASGSGKSSLLYLMGLLDLPSSGRVWLEGADTSRLSDDQLADLRLKKLGFVFQFHFLLHEFSALENVALPIQRLGEISADDAKRSAAEILCSLGLGEYVNRLPTELSGGQRQRVAIARALANRPKVILADEPSGNLDRASTANVQALLRQLSRDHGCAVVVVTHDAEFAAAADRVVTIVDGRIVV